MIFRHLFQICLNLLNLCGDFCVTFCVLGQLIVRIDSGRSPPGRPGFQIRPLRPDAEIPSGRKETWLGEHDCKNNFQVRKYKMQR